MLLHLIYGTVVLKILTSHPPFGFYQTLVPTQHLSHICISLYDQPTHSYFLTESSIKGLKSCGMETLLCALYL
jgi:hypothetical protein